MYYLLPNNFVGGAAAALLPGSRAYIQGGPKKVSLIIFAITLSTASQFS